MGHRGPVRPALCRSRGIYRAYRAEAERHARTLDVYQVPGTIQFLSMCFISYSRRPPLSDRTHPCSGRIASTKGGGCKSRPPSATGGHRVTNHITRVCVMHIHAVYKGTCISYATQLKRPFFLLGRVRIVFNEAKGASYSNSVFKNTGFFFPFLLSCKIRPQNSRIRFLSAAAFLDSIS